MENQRQFLRAKLPLERVCINVFRDDMAILSCVHAAVENISEGGIGLKILKYKKHYDRFFNMVKDYDNAYVAVHVKMSLAPSCNSCSRPAGKPAKKDFLCNLISQPIICQMVWIKNVQLGLQFTSLDDLTRRKVYKSILDLEAKQRRFEKEQQMNAMMRPKSVGGAISETAATETPVEFEVPDFAICDLFKKGACLARDEMVDCKGYILNCK